MLTIQTTSTTRSSSVLTLKRPHNPSRLQITNRSFYHSAPVLWNAFPKELRLYNSGHLGNRSIHHLMSYCLLFYFTKSLNPISFLILFLHSLSAIWTDLLVLTLALFIFIHSHFHYSFIFISLTAFLFYRLTSTVSLNKLSFSCSAFC
jgi:hypothetical protein